MTVKYYKSIEEKNLIEGEYHLKGYRVSHNDFIDGNEKPTNGTCGKLTLIEDMPPDNTNLIQFKLLKKKLIQDTITFDELKKYLRLRLEL